MQKMKTNIPEFQMRTNKTSYGKTIVSSNNRTFGKIDTSDGKFKNKQTFGSHGVQTNQSSFKVLN